MRSPGSPVTEAIPLGAFELLAPIGQGGMGQVWRGRHADEGIAVAVKIMALGDAWDPRFHEAFKNELRAVSRLDHEHVVRVFDSGRITAEVAQASEGRLSEGSPWLAMEYLGGGALSKRCGRMDWPRARTVLLDLLDALGHAHARGVIHRDVKPPNILLREGAGVVLTDFGLAHARAVELQPGHEEAVAGTIPYMAPEQFGGDWRAHGPWTDLYALGCVGWALVTGRPPFSFDDPWRTMNAHLHRRLPRFDPVRPVPLGLEGWLLRLLEKDPSRRFRRAADAAWALRALPQHTEPTLAPSPRRSIAVSPGVEREAATIPFDSDFNFMLSEQAEGTLFDMPLGLDLDPGPVWAGTSPTPPCPDDWRGDEPPAPLPVGVGLGLYGMRTVRLVGREAERDALWEQLRAVASSGRARAVLLRGPTGGGKSRLAGWLCERSHELGAASSVRVSHTPAGSTADGLAAALVRRLRCVGLDRADVLVRVEREVRTLGVSDAEEVHALTELLSPASGGDLAQGARPIRLETSTERHVVVRRFLERMAMERPVVLHLDDVHWGPDAVAFTRHLLAAQDDEPAAVLVVLSACDEVVARSPAVDASLRALLSVEGVSSLEVRPLSAEHRSELVRGLLGLSGELAARVEQRCAGNPQFAVQLVGDWVERGLLQRGRGGYELREGARVELPSDLAGIWAERLEQVLEGHPEQEGLALELAAVLGDTVDGAEWEELCRRAPGLEQLPPVGLVDRLLDRCLVVPSEEGPSSGWSFAHAMFWEAVLARAGDRRPGHHARCAEVLGERVGRGVAERRGRHLLEAGDAKGAVDLLLEGVAERADAGEGHEALLLLGEVDRAFELQPAAEGDERQGLAWLRRAGLEISRGHDAVAEDWLLKAEAASSDGRWPLVAARCLDVRGKLARFRGDLPRSRRLLEEAVWRLEAVAGWRDRAQCLRLLGHTQVHMGDFPAAEASFERALHISQAHDDLAGVAGCLLGLGEAAKNAGDLGRAVTFVSDALRHHERRGSREGMSDSYNVLGDLARMGGDLSRAEVHYREALKLYRAIGSGTDVICEVNLGIVLSQRGHHRPAQRMLDGAIRGLERQGRMGFAGAAHAISLPSAAGREDWDAWDLHMDRARESLADGGLVDPDIAALAQQGGDAAAAAGEVERAREAWQLALCQWEALERVAEAGVVRAALAGSRP